MNEIDHITNYLRSGENSGHRLGLELEHFVLNAWGESISFETLSRLVERIGTSLGAKLAVIDGHVMGYSVEEYSVSMEPACQLEISISPYEDIEKIKRIYDNFYILWREALLEDNKILRLRLPQALLLRLDRGLERRDHVPDPRILRLQRAAERGTSNVPGPAV